MKRYEIVFREILQKVSEEGKHEFTQSELSKKLGISLSIVNSAVSKLERIGAVKVFQRSFRVIDFKKALYYWASARNLGKDIIFSARADLPVREVERNMPSEIIFTAFSAYKFRLDDVPADYSEVYFYANEKELEKIKRRFKFKAQGRHNFFILKKDDLIDSYKNIPLVQIFVDLWNIKEWYAKEFVESLEKKFEEMKK